MANDVKLRIGADTSELERAFGTLIKKIQADADKLKVSAGSKAAPGISANTDREQLKNKSFTDAQSKQYAAIVKSLKEEYALLQQIGREREKQSRQEHLSNIQKATFHQTQRAQGWGVRGGVPGGPTPPPAPPPPGGGAGGGNFPKGGITSLAGAASFLGVPAALIGGAATAVAAGAAAEGIRRFFGEASYRAREKEASAFNVQGQGGQRLQSFLNGGAAEEMMFNPQRMQASKTADEYMQKRLNSNFRIFTNPIQTIFGNSKVGQQFGLGSKGLQDEITADQEKERNDMQARQFEAYKKGPAGAMRTALADKYLSTYQRDLDFQRQMGLNTDTLRGKFEGPTGQFTGGFLNSVQSAGFTGEQGMSMASGIMGSGGSTRASKEAASFALQMQRRFDLTNAGQAIGAISGQLGSGQMSKEALIKIQAEGTRIGVNQADFVEENRRFVEMAANVINQSNVTSGAGVDQLVGTLGRFMGEKTITGMEAGKNAYMAYQQQSNIQTGPSSVMRAAGMIKSPMLQKLSAEDQASLFTLNQSDVNVDNLGIQAMAKKAGMSAQDLVNAYHSTQESSMFQRKSTDAAIGRLKAQYAKQTGPVASGAAYGAGLEGAASAEGEALNAVRLEQIGQGLDEKSRLALVRGQATGDKTAVSKLLEEGVKTGAESGKTGRPEDETNKVQAEASRLATQMFMNIKDSIVPASDAARNFAQEINGLMSAMRGASPADAAKLWTNFQSKTGMAPSTQPSAGPASSGPGSGGR